MAEQPERPEVEMFRNQAKAAVDLRSDPDPIVAKIARMYGEEVIRNAPRIVAWVEYLEAENDRLMEGTIAYG